MSLSDDVKGFAREVGFDLVGVAPVEPLREAERAILERLRSGMLEGMGWMTEERIRLSCDPARLLPGARSVLALGKQYQAPDSDLLAAAKGPRGRVARYARGDDYHDSFRPRLESILDMVARSAGRRPVARLFVDSSPLAEKVVAACSGVGWFGKNSCLLTLRHGSWVLLAEILTDLELEPDSPLDRDCGRCRICLDRCPTGALVAPYEMDAPRCISYLTIEHKGAIPLELRPLMGNWIFGCDICQEVCPWNRLRGLSEDAGSSPRLGLDAAPELIPLLELDARGFKERFRGSAMLRPKRRGLLRNVAVALGNSRDPAAVPVLARALGDEEPLIRSHVAWALGQIATPLARRVLEGALSIEPSESVRDEIKAALEWSTSPWV